MHVISMARNISSNFP
jgi:hypothetical protein